jgi:hypothetical protein
VSSCQGGLIGLFQWPFLRIVVSIFFCKFVPVGG